jgi:hypothetical protein
MLGRKVIFINKFWDDACKLSEGVIVGVREDSVDIEHMETSYYYNELTKQHDLPECNEETSLFIKLDQIYFI